MSEKREKKPDKQNLKSILKPRKHKLPQEKKHNENNTCKC